MLNTPGRHYFHNVIVFGETGAGKTSVVEMLLEGPTIVEDTASSVIRATEQTRSYNIDIRYRHYVIHDTVGLNDMKDSDSAKKAMRDLYQLISKVEGGVSLLVYVYRNRIISHKVNHYKLFHHAVCEGQVPTALVITALEELLPNTEGWWSQNKSSFEARGIQTKYHACITSTKGGYNERLGGYVYQEKYDGSKKKLSDVIFEATREEPWKAKNTTKWLTRFLVEVYNIFAGNFGWESLVANPSLLQMLLKIGVPEKEAKEEVNNLERVTTPRPQT